MSPIGTSLCEQGGFLTHDIMDVQKELAASEKAIRELNRNHAAFQKEWTAFAENRSCDKQLIGDHLNNMVTITTKMTMRNQMLIMEVDSVLKDAKAYYRKGSHKSWIIGGILVFLYVAMTIVNLLLK